MRRGKSPHRSKWIATGLGAVILVLAGCDHAVQPPTASLTRPAPTSVDSAATERVDRLAVEAAYRRYWTVSRTFDRQYPESQWRRVLAEVAAEPHLGLVLARTRTQHRDGIRLYGQVVPHLTVLPIGGADTAVVRDCQDASHAGQADAATGRPRTVGVPRNPVLGRLRRGSDRVWRVYSIEFPEERC